MDWKLFFSTFTAVFIAELGDKTQLATLALTAQSKKPLLIFLAGSAALIAATAMGVLIGESVYRIMPAEYISRLSAILFIGIGMLLWFKII